MAFIIPQMHLSGLLDVCQTRSLLLRLKLQDKKIGLFLRAIGYIFQSAVCAVPWGGSQPNTFSLIVIGLWGSRMQALLAMRARQSRIVPWAPDLKPWGTHHVQKLPSRRY